MANLDTLLGSYQQAKDTQAEEWLIAFHASSLVEYAQTPTCTYNDASKIYMLLRFNQDPNLSDARDALSEKIETFDQALNIYLKTATIKIHINRTNRGECPPDKTLKRRAGLKAKNRAASLDQKVHLYAAAEKGDDLPLSAQMQQAILKEGAETNNLQTIYCQAYILKLGKLKREVHNLMLSSPDEQERFHAYSSALEWGKEFLPETREALLRPITSHSTAIQVYTRFYGFHDAPFLPKIHKKIIETTHSFDDWYTVSILAKVREDKELLTIASKMLTTLASSYTEILGLYDKEEKESSLAVSLHDIIANGTDQIPELEHAYKLATAKSDNDIALRLKRKIYAGASMLELYHFFHTSNVSVKQIPVEIMKIISAKLKTKMKKKNPTSAEKPKNHTPIQNI